MSSTPQAEIGIIGGSGFYSFAADAEPVTVSTPYGDPSGDVLVGQLAGRGVAFLPRHGPAHEHPPHLVNYRANLWALRSLGVRQVLAPCAVGSLRPELGPGTIVVPDQLVDRTWGRAHTFFDRTGPVGHVAFADPYCPRGRAAVLGAAPDLVDGGTLVVVNGPRFSSRAESRWHAAQGWSLVGMTGQPEAALARELALCYTSVALVTDLDAGLAEGDYVTHAEVLRIFRANLDRLKDLLAVTVPALPVTEADDVADCPCRRALDGLPTPIPRSLMAQLPDGEPVPTDGALPPEISTSVGTRPFGAYLHVPFCTSRCGYCDFNTYTAAELRGAPGADRDVFVAAAIAELDLAARVLGRPVEVATIFVGGGTPTVLPVGALGRLVAAVGERWPLAADVEITTEANPESVDAGSLDRLAADGFTRISFGMQSAIPHVLATLDRVHSPGRPARMVSQARAAGIEHVSLDLIYGTPGESLDDWRVSLETAVAAAPDHVSAYALVVESGTRLASRVRRGQLPAPDPDDLADKYLLAEELLSAAGFAAYEVSNWARSPGARCRHNLGYWRDDDWWGIGPGAHSHVGGMRWWNVKHPARYAARLAAGVSPAQGRERLTETDRHLERVMLGVRLADGLDVAALTATGRGRLPELVRRKLVLPDPERVRLTVQGRLLADAVVRELVD